MPWLNYSLDNNSLSTSSSLCSFNWFCVLLNSCCASPQKWLHFRVGRRDSYSQFLYPFFKVLWKPDTSLPCISCSHLHLCKISAKCIQNITILIWNHFTVTVIIIYYHFLFTVTGLYYGEERFASMTFCKPQK